jgi:hypothetical protein
MVQYEGSSSLAGPLGTATELNGGSGSTPQPITFLDGKVSSELMAEIDQNITARTILEIKPALSAQFQDQFRRLQLPSFLSLDFKKFGLKFVSTVLMRKHLDKLVGMESVKGVHLDRITKILYNWDYPIANAARSMIPRREYKLAPGEVPTSTSGNAIGIDKARADGFSGNGIKAAILDTGLAANRQVPLGSISTKSVITKFGGNMDPSGHGTNVNTIFGGKKLTIGPGVVLEGMAPDAQITSVRCLFTPLGIGLNSFTLKALQTAADLDVDIVSLSLGTSAPTPTEDPTWKVVQAMVNDGKLVFTSAGNSQHTLPGQINGPADINGIISVGAWSLTDSAPAYFSSRGQTWDGRPGPHFYAPGGGRATSDLKPMEGILSSTSGYLDMVSGGFKLAALPGTSQACPHMAGLAALWQEYVLKKTGNKLTAADLVTISKKFGGSSALVQYDWIKEVI